MGQYDWKGQTVGPDDETVGVLEGLLDLFSDKKKQGGKKNEQNEKASFRTIDPHG